MCEVQEKKDSWLQMMIALKMTIYCAIYLFSCLFNLKKKRFSFKNVVVITSVFALLTFNILSFQIYNTYICIKYFKG